MNMTTDMALPEQASALQVFTSDGGLDPIIQEARLHVASFEHDLTTVAGRKRTASLSAKVAKLKVRLDDMGKELVADWKQKAKIVDQSRRKMRDDLDNLKILARKPLTEWEEEEARVKAEEEARAEAERVSREIEDAHELAILMDDKITREREEEEREIALKRKEEEERIERERAEHEEKIRIEAAESARKEAEVKARAAREEAERREAEAIAKAERAAKELEEAEERARMQELRRIAAAEQAERDKIAAESRARQDEIDRQEEERAAEERLKAAREANKRHVSRVRTQAKDSIVALGIDEDTARRLVLAIHRREIDNVSIIY